MSEFMINNKPLSTLRVVDLKEELEKRGLSKSGNKKELIEKLRAQLEIEQNSSQATVSAVEQVTATNDFVKQYLANQQETLQKQLEVRRQVILSEGGQADEIPVLEQIAEPKENSDLQENMVQKEEPQVSVFDQETPQNTKNVDKEETFYGSSDEVKHQIQPETAISEQIDEVFKEKNFSKEEPLPQNESCIEPDPPNVAESVEKPFESFKETALVSETTEPASQIQVNEQSVPESSLNGTMDMSQEDDKNSTDSSAIIEDKLDDTSDTVRENGSSRKLKLPLMRTSSNEGLKQDERKRRWGGSTGPLNASAATISSDALKDLIKPKEIETEAEDGELEAKATDSKRQCTESNVKDDTKDEKEDGEMDENITEERSAPKNPPSNVLLVSNLVRPFTLARLKETLSKKGPIQVDKFWIDKIKSKCYAVYETQEVAIESREYLHGLKWPNANAKPLEADFVNPDELQKILEDEKKECEKAAAALVAPVVKKEPISPFQAKKVEKLSDVNIKKETSEEVVKAIVPVEKKQAKHPTSNIVFVCNLVRPFTLPQLKELLSKDGPIVEERFWIDKIKSKCYAQFESEEIAIKTRERLNGLKWPTGNPKTLQADFSNKEELDRCFNNDRKFEELKKKKEEEAEKRAQAAEERKKKQEEERVARAEAKENAKNVKQEKVREWDREKLEEKDFKKMRTASPVSNKTERPKRESESSAKLLDDLFKKTVTTPCIYWLPLTDLEAEQVKTHGGKEMRKQKVLLRERKRLEREAREKDRPANNGRNRSPIRRVPSPRRERSPVRFGDRGGRPPFRDRERERPWARDRSNDRPPAFGGRRAFSPPRGRRRSLSPPRRNVGGGYRSRTRSRSVSRSRSSYGGSSRSRSRSPVNRGPPRRNFGRR